MALRLSLHLVRRSTRTLSTRQWSQCANLTLSSLRRGFSSLPSHEIVGMPSLSPTMESGTIAAWKIKEGESFAAGDVFCSVETDKATVDFEAQDEGVVAKILAPAGPQEVKRGEPILITVSQESDVAAFVNYNTSLSLQSMENKPVSSIEAAPVSPPELKLQPVAEAALPAASLTHSGGTRVIASPLAHLLAKELGHNITNIVGTGPGGRIIAADVKEYVPVSSGLPVGEVPTTPPSLPPPKPVSVPATPIHGTGYTDFPLSEAAREIAARLTLSKQHVPHYYLTVDICMDKVLDLRSTLNSAIGDGKKLGVYEILLKAAALSMKTVPAVNSSWMESVVRVYDSVDINVVIGNADVLYTPVIRNCGSIGLKSISDDLATAMAALENETFGEAFSSVGTFSVVNLGAYGIKSCAPIIREPQSCALAFGAIQNQIVPNDDGDDDDQLYKQCTMMTATLSCDHRVVDGAVGAQWLSTFKAHVENPTTLLI